MKKTFTKLPIVFLLISFVYFSPSLDACTTFCLKDGTRLVFGRNYDWGIGYGYVMVNRRDMIKRAFNLFDPESKPVKWISKFGSITFNQYGKEYPMGGMNEAGLVVEVMWLAGTRFPSADSRRSLDELPWVQYQLDKFSTVREVIESDSSVRITTNSQPIHFLVCDRKGEAATIEFLDGKMVYHTKDTFPVEVLANDTYEDSIRYLRRHKNFGGNRSMPSSGSSLDRFTRAAYMLQKYRQDSSQDIVDYAFSILDSVKQEGGTQWSIVYNLKELSVYFKTKDAPKIKSFLFKDFDFACVTPSSVINMHTDKSSDISQYFVKYSSSINRKLIGLSFRGTDFLQDIPDEALDQLSRYPESIICSTKK